MSEKAIAIGQYFVASGRLHPVRGDLAHHRLRRSSPTTCSRAWKKSYGGKWDFETDPELAAKKMIAHIDKKRKALGIDKARERVLYDMDMRREMEEAAHAAEH